MPRRKPEAEVRQPDVKEVRGAHDALRYLRYKDFLLTQRWTEQQMRADRQGAHPEILAFEKAFIARFRRLGIPMFAHSVWRTPEEQTRLYVTGFSNAMPEDAPHCGGVAVDLIHSIKGWEIPTLGWKLIGEIGKEVAQRIGVKVEWGGDWKTRKFPEGDPAHWQLKDWRTKTLSRE